jgi:hypothetical protein
LGWSSSSGTMRSQKERMPSTTGLAKERLRPEEVLGDISQLLRSISGIHPDPYTGGGGPLKFHRAVSEVLLAVPSRGWSRWELLQRLRRIVALLRDGHSEIGFDRRIRRESRRLWMNFDILDHRLFITGVRHPSHLRLLGARLESVNSVPFLVLLRRADELWGSENEYSSLNHLAALLQQGFGITGLLNQGSPPTQVSMEVTLADQKHEVFHVRLGKKASSPPLTAESKLALPRRDTADLAAGFLGKKREIGYLGFGGLLKYREALEHSRALGLDWVFSNYLPGIVGPEGRGRTVEDWISSAPSASDLVSKFVERAEATKPWLILVDLRGAWGGDDIEWCVKIG